GRGGEGAFDLLHQALLSPSRIDVDPEIGGFATELLEIRGVARPVAAGAGVSGDGTTCGRRADLDEAVAERLELLLRHRDLAASGQRLEVTAAAPAHAPIVRPLQSYATHVPSVRCPTSSSHAGCRCCRRSRT